MFAECNKASVFGVEKDKKRTYATKEKPSKPSLLNKEIDLKLDKNTSRTKKRKTKNCTTIMGPQTGGEGNGGGWYDGGCGREGFVWEESGRSSGKGKGEEWTIINSQKAQQRPFCCDVGWVLSVCLNIGFFKVLFRTTDANQIYVTNHRKTNG